MGMSHDPHAGAAPRGARAQTMIAVHTRCTHFHVQMFLKGLMIKTIGHLRYNIWKTVRRDHDFACHFPNIMFSACPSPRARPESTFGASL